MAAIYNTQEHETSNHILSEQVEMLANTTRSALVSSAFIVIGTIIYFRSEENVVLWAIAALTMVLLRGLLYWVYVSPGIIVKLTTWARLYTLALCITGALWGSTIFLFATGADYADKLVISIIIICTVTGGSYFYVSHLPGALGIMLFGSVPYVIFMFLQDTNAERAIGILCLFFIATLLRFTLTFNQWFAHTIRSRIALERQAGELSTALAEADKFSRMQADFLANVSHEIRTPLTGMLSMLQFLIAEPQTDERGKYLQVAYNSARTMQVLMGDILDMSKLQAGKFTIEPSPCELHSLINDTLILLTPMADEKGLALSTHINSSEQLWVNIDSARFRQVLFNLVGNAIKFTETGAVSIDIKATDTGSDSYQLRCQISDTGIGIDAAMLPTLFNRFVQADTTLSRQHPGTGLGLAICRELLELMDGEISVESHLDQGSVFTFTLIANKAQPAVEEVKKPEYPPLAKANYHLLIVDDNPVNLIILKKLVSSFGWSADAVDSGEQAIASFRDNPQRYDLILMDIQMPKMDGLQATQEIRRCGAAGQAIPIIAVTANSYSQDSSKLRTHNINDCVGKPIDAQLLYDAIVRALDIKVKKRAIS